MERKQIISVVLNGHLPFVRHPERRQPCEEQWFFEALSETWLPLLEALDRLDGDHVPFCLALSLSPTLCHMLRDKMLLRRYLEYTDRQIEFGRRELERTAAEGELHALARTYYDRQIERRISFTERHEKNILKAFDYYQRKGRIEILATAATHAFFPFLVSFPEAMHAQIEVATGVCRRHFGKYPQGFWLPELGWTGEIEAYLRSFNFGYTIVDTHGTVFGRPPAKKGSFYPVKTPQGIFVLARDYHAAEHMSRIVRAGSYRDNGRDAGYELPAGVIGPFMNCSGGRGSTGDKYWNSGKNGRNPLYNPREAGEKAADHAREFLEERSARLQAAEKHMEESPVSLCVFDADSLGRFWHEGPVFLESLFRMGRGYQNIRFMTPSEYLYKQDAGTFQVSAPEFSSGGMNGYAETWLDASNDWMYRHLNRAMDRMVELAERFPDDSGLKERTLNQAAREILLAQASDWPRMLYRQESAEYARSQIEGALRNFTTIYEALGSGYISTEWLTSLEKRHNIFPDINYRIFRRKRDGKNPGSR
jgi:1,4-alpha-glucan branching enzyme